MSRSFQIFNTQFQMNLKFNLPPSKVILPERMSADLRVIPSHLSVINLQTIFFRPINLKKEEFVFLLADGNIEKFRLTDSSSKINCLRYMTLSRRYPINFDFNSVN